jgi:hypothetical protein
MLDSRDVKAHITNRHNIFMLVTFQEARFYLTNKAAKKKSFHYTFKFTDKRVEQYNEERKKNLKTLCTVFMIFKKFLFTIDLNF